MNSVETLLLGVALGAIPHAELGYIAVAKVSKALGVKPGDIRKYRDVTDSGNDSGGGDSE